MPMFLTPPDADLPAMHRLVTDLSDFATSPDRFRAEVEAHGQVTDWADGGLWIRLHGAMVIADDWASGWFIWSQEAIRLLRLEARKREVCDELRAFAAGTVTPP